VRVNPVSALIGTSQAVTISRSESALNAARLMAAREIGALPIVDEHRLTGIVTERDILARVVASGRDPATTPVGDIMSTNLVVADVSEGCAVCLQRMRQAHIRHLILLDRTQGGRFAGIVSLRDLLSRDLAEKDDQVRLLNAYVVV
jgi:CBS domain-containing protein